ncbi:MAG: serine/threonine-protein phosphatase [Flexilinea sp.]|nr:serine/threonine-protein phosphatase [Flexilinea sp.]
MKERHRKLVEKVEARLTIRKKSSGYIGLCVIVLLTLLLNIFILLRGNGNMEFGWGFNIGVNLMGGFVCAVIYYSCLQDTAGVGKRNPLFLSLLITSSIGMFLSACAWLVQGIAAIAFINRLIHTFLFINNYMMIFLFWRCELFMLEIDERLDRFVNNFLQFYLLPVLIIILANFFVPILFTVDAEGVYLRTKWFSLLFILMFPAILGIILGIITSKSSKKDKLIVASFIGLPLIVFLNSLFNSEISILESAMFLSVMIIYLTLINERGKKLAVTQTELKTATDIQASMLPHIFPPYPDREEFDLFASMDPAREVGGDFYDFFLIDEDHLAVLIADVSDKGIPAALFMMSTKILINYRARKGGTPAEILTDINAQIARDNESKMFVTIWMGILDVNTGVLTCTNAGHEYPAVCGPDGVFRIFRDKHGLVVGAMETAKYRDYELMLHPGDRIFVYTDGVPEANNSDGELYGMERLEAALNRSAKESPEQILNDIRADVDRFVNGAKQFDDLTMLCLEYKGKQIRKDL